MDRYSTFWPRLWAGIVDGLVFVPVGLLDLYLGAPERSQSVLIVWGVVSYSSYWLYGVILHAMFGQTLGKMVAGVRVLDLGEAGIPSLAQAFVRDIGYIILNCAAFLNFASLVFSGRYAHGTEVVGGQAALLSAAGLGWSLLEVLTMLTNEKRRAIHDFIAGTVVVKDFGRRRW
jgi:uncharacterized RDD family membrane protein YckC